LEVEIDQCGTKSLWQTWLWSSRMMMANPFSNPRKLPILTDVTSFWLKKI
jgi:hypothetical protein